MLMSHARNGDEFRTPRHRGSSAKIDVLAFVILVNPKVIWNSWNLACYHGAASICRGKIFVPFGAGLGICFSQTRASHSKCDGFGRERFTFLDETISIGSSWFQFFSQCQHRTTGVLCQFLGFFGVRLDTYIHQLSFYAFMCIIKIWTTCTCSNAYKLVENSNMYSWLHA